MNEKNRVYKIMMLSAAGLIVLFLIVPSLPQVQKFIFNATKFGGPLHLLVDSSQAVRLIDPQQRQNIKPKTSALLAQTYFQNDSDSISNPQTRHLVFWANWCQPCIDEMPTLFSSLMKLRLLKSEYEMIFINIDDSPDEIAKAREIQKTLAPKVFAIYESGLQIAKIEDVTGLPYHIWIDADGKILLRKIGVFLKAEEIIEIADLIKRQTN